MASQSGKNAGTLRIIREAGGIERCRIPISMPSESGEIEYR